MIVPYHLTGDEHLMAKNLSKYFRHKFAIKPKHANDNMLTNVSFKVFKVKNVPSFKGSPDKKNELIAKAIQTTDLSGGKYCRRHFSALCVKNEAGAVQSQIVHFDRSSRDCLAVLLIGWLSV